MKLPLRLLTIGLLFIGLTLPSTRVFAGYNSLPPLQEETPTPTLEESTPTPAAIYPADIINAVNDLRGRNGLPMLAIHQALMEVAAQTANALAATEGAAGHYRPCNMTLGQLLLVRGFALWGDLSQDGYRSEDWVSAQTVDQAISFWLSDQLHSDTMLSEHRSHIGAAVAVGDQIYMVIVTALQTPSGKMQWGADVHLTQAAAVQSNCTGRSTSGAQSGDLSQYSIPVSLSTARPDGDVVHEVKYGQTLWSIAIQYGTTIDELKRLNGLTDNTVVTGWKLLVQKGATQPAPPTATFILSPQTEMPTRTPAWTGTPASTATPGEMSVLTQSLGANKLVVAAMIVSFSVLVGGIVGFRKRKEE
jgi:LysM repeat protein